MSHNRSKHQPVNFFKLLQTIHIPRHDIPIRPSNNNNLVKPHPTPQDLAITEPSNPTEADSHDLTNAIHRFRGLANGDYSKDFDEETGHSRLYPENLQTDVDEIFDNFDKCYQASYPKTSQALSSTNLTIEPRPVCRELLRELSIEPASKKSNKNIQQPMKKSTPQQISKHIQPKEFPTLKTGQYFSTKPSLVSSDEFASIKQTGEDVKTVRANGGKQLEKYYTAGVRFLSQPMKLKVVNKTLEESKFSDDKENLGGGGNRDSEESKPKAQKTFMFVQNSAFSMIDTNYRVVQETLRKIRNTDTGGKDTTKNKDVKEILTDITNDDRPTRRTLLKENGELRPLSSGASGRRKNPVKEIHQKREEPERVSYNSLNKGRINIPEMIHYKQAKENLCPAGANKLVNTRIKEVQRESVKAAEKMIGNRRNSVGGVGRGAQETKLKKIVGGNTNTSNLEKRPVRHERNSTDVGISKEDITRYFALAKRNIMNISNGNKNNGSRRSLSGTRW